MRSAVPGEGLLRASGRGVATRRGVGGGGGRRIPRGRPPGAAHRARLCATLEGRGGGYPARGGLPGPAAGADRSGLGGALRAPLECKILDSIAIESTVRVSMARVKRSAGR